MKSLHEDKNCHHFFLDIIPHVLSLHITWLFTYDKEIEPDKVKDQHLFVEQAAGMILVLSNYTKISETQILNQSIFKILRTKWVGNLE